MEAKCSADQTALHVILKNCQLFPTKPALHWLDENCKITEEYSYEEVEHRTRELAHGLLNLIQRKESAPCDVLVRERAVLCYPPGLEFILTFLACLRAGIIAVPVSPPSLHQTDYSMEMLVRIIHDCGAAFVLTSKEFANHKSIVEVMQTTSIPWHCEVATEILPEESNESEISELLDKAKPEDIPFLLYTSGSTGNPKGVMPTHNSLLHNFMLMQEIMETDSSMVEISFLPHFHAMGLVCSYLQTIYHGGTGYFMSPTTFVENPGLWMKAFSLFNGTHSKAPNFAFELVLKKEFPKNINLGTARYIVSGSEPVFVETIREFESAMAPHGLKKNTVRVGYGMAEHAVYLCGVRNHSDPVIVDGRISCGVPIPGVIIKIVDPETHSVMPKGEEGEIWVDSPCKALGYWEKEERSQKVFEAQLDEAGDRTYLRTGDLGFMKDGELFVSGRLKNIIITYGRKIHPSDIEMRIESSFTMLQPGRTVACEYTGEKIKDPLLSKGIALVAELQSPKSHTIAQLDQLAQRISTMIGLNFQVEVNLVTFLQPQTMPCTMSGKRQRSLCRKKLLKNSLEEVYRWSRYLTIDQKVHHMSPPSTSRTATGLYSSAMEAVESESTTTVQVLTQPSIDINILEPSDSESSLEKPTNSDNYGEANSNENTRSLEQSDLQEVDGDGMIPTLTLHYPDLVRIARRKSAPPLPVDREDKLLASNGSRQPRRKSTMEKSSSLSRLYKRRNSLQTLTDTVSGVLGVQLQPDSNIWAHGCNSIKVIHLSQCLQSEFGFAVEPHHLFAHQTPKALLGKLQRSLLNMSSPPSAGSNQSDETLAIVDECSGSAVGSGGTGLDTLHEDVQEGIEAGAQPLDGKHGRDIAIVGMAGTFAGCNNIGELWQLLLSKKVATSSHFVPSLEEPLSGGFTSAVGIFDHKWFGVSEWEASTMDPQQSILLHVAWECLENAGCVKNLSSFQRGKSLNGSDCGVFVGISMDNDAHYLSHSQEVTPLPTNITSSVAANRVARTFNLKGPVMSVDTACASSLSVLDAACKALKDEDCSSALVCGVNAILDPYRYTLLKKMGMLSPDELCKVFDESANGYVRGEGCGAVLLMPLAQAEREGQRILAVIKSTASNNNGASSATLTSPSGKDQERLMDRALRKASLSTKDIVYIEAHGTGTKLGDPIEADAIQAVFGSEEPTMMQIKSEGDGKVTKFSSKKNSSNKPTVVVGSVKANVGHLETGAGIVGLIKTVMVLEHSTAPGNACLEKLNPCFRLSDNICITSENTLLKRALSTGRASPLLAALVNSFGFGGTNATTVLQQYTTLPHMAQSECTLLFSTDDDKCEIGKSLKDAINYLSCRFPKFQAAMSTCDAVIKKAAANLGEMCFDVSRATVMKFYYSLVALLRSLGLKVVTVGGTDIVGEILSLVIANCLDLSHAMVLVLTSWPAADTCLQDIQKIIQPPAMPVFSYTLDKVCRPSQSPSEIGSCQYCMQMISKLRTRRNSPQQSSTFTPHAVNNNFSMERLLRAIEGDSTAPILSLTVDASVKFEDSSQIAQIVINMSKFQGMGNERAHHVEQYVREKLIELRNTCDRARITKCSSRPTKTVENLLPNFHQRYPLRIHVDPKPQPEMDDLKPQVSSPSTEGGRMVEYKTTPTTIRTPSPLACKSVDSGSRHYMNQRKLSTLSTSSSVESGYITQENSRESLPTSVPPNTPISAPPERVESHDTLEYKLDKDQLVLALKDNHHLSTNEDQDKWKVVSSILEEIKDDLDSPDLSLEEFAENSMYELGLDSLNVMHTADFIKKKFDVKMTFSEMTDHGTVGQLAEFIMQQSPVFKKSGTTTPPSSTPPMLRAQQKSASSLDVYPILTKEGYYTHPSLETIRKMQPTKAIVGGHSSSNTKSSLHLYVKDFTVGRKGFGKIVFVGETDVAYFDLDKLVHIEEKAVSLSPDQPGSSSLNKPATVYFENVCSEFEVMNGGDGALAQPLHEQCARAMPAGHLVKYQTDSRQIVMKMEKFY